MNNTKKIFLFIVCIFIQNLSAMDQHVVPLEGSDLVFNLVFTHYLLDHEAMCSFAAISKIHNASMLATAEQRKKLVPCQRSLVGVHMGRIWHKYGSACSYAYETPCDNELALVCSALGSKSMLSNSVGFISPLPYNPPPFFNDEGMLCFYGYGEKHILLEEPIIQYLGSQKIKSIMRYDLADSCFRCFFFYKDSTKNAYNRHDLCQFINYPFLLKAILNSTIVSEQKRYGMCDNVIEKYLAYYLDGVTVPDNYVEQNKSDGTIFDNLPEDLKSAISKRYKAQPKNGAASTP